MEEEKSDKETIISSSWTKMPMKLIADKTFTGSDLRVYAMINMFYSIYKTAYPSLKYLSKSLDMNYVTVSKSITKLSKSGYLSIKRNGIGKNNTYEVTPNLE